MSIGLRDQRVRLYSYSDTGTDGIVVSQYSYIAERWARKESPTGRDLMLASAREHVVDAAFTFADEVAILPNYLLKHNSVYYEIESVLPRRATREIHVLARSVDVAQANYTVVDDA